MWITLVKYSRDYWEKMRAVLGLRKIFLILKCFKMNVPFENFQVKYWPEKTLLKCGDNPEWNVKLRCPWWHQQRGTLKIVYPMLFVGKWVHRTEVLMAVKPKRTRSWSELEQHHMHFWRLQVRIDDISKNSSTLDQNRLYISCFRTFAHGSRCCTLSKSVLMNVS